jgi:hypothetical protein
MSEAKPVKRYKDMYGKWGYQPGTAPDFMRCAEEVPHKWTWRQCTRKCGNGPDRAYCKQHAKARSFEI